MKILVVDDHAINRDLLRAQLEAEGHAVVEAADGVEALQVLRREPVQAVFSDILMPNMDGFRLCREMRCEERFAALPFILYTSTYESPSDRKLARSVGADRYLVKPAPVPVILGALEDALRSRGSSAASTPPPPDEAYVLAQYNEALVHKLEESNVRLQHALEESRLAHERILELNATLERRVAERTAQLEAANRAKDSFLAAMSHEVRTPLAGLLGSLELLGLSKLDAEPRQALETAFASARGLARIVDDILDWSKIQAGKLRLDPAPTSLREVVAQVANTYMPVAQAKGVAFSYRVDPAISPALMVDPLRLSQVMNNFVSNAIKFTASGEVQMRAELAGRAEGIETIRLSVCDTGPGMEETVVARLFRSYEQLSPQTARMYGGTGLGLAICRRLADLMDGTIEVSTAPGRGSTFSLTLGLAVAREQPPAGAEAPIAPFASAGDAAAPLVLVVDDHPINRELLGRQLRTLGLRAQAASSGAEALRMWREGRFDAVITDCHMPEMDGYALAGAIRELEAGRGRPRTPIIAWTANAMSEEQQLCRQAGMDDLLVKPAGLARLREAMLRWLPRESAAAPAGCKAPVS